MTQRKYHLISSKTCPWVQRAVIVLRAKNVAFEVTHVDLRDKPGWFLKISPRGKVPVLVVDGQPLFESSAIAEYLDEMEAPSLHPADPIKRARNRAWTGYLPDVAQDLTAINYTKSRSEMPERVEAARKKLRLLEEALSVERGNDGPYFNGDTLSMVDASYIPFLQRHLLVERVLRSGLLNEFPKIAEWAKAVLAHPAVAGSLASDFEAAYVEGLNRRGAFAGKLFETAA